LEIPIKTTHQDTKAMRGTKRLCHACEVRFYDLHRDPIVCPACGAHHAPEAVQTVEARARPTRFINKTGWRSRAFGRPDSGTQAAPGRDALEPAATEETAEEGLGPVQSEDVVLDEQEPDEADVSGLVDHGRTESEER
jgi:uncharacterized protein (TIGR02300 family)